MHVSVRVASVAVLALACASEAVRPEAARRAVATPVLGPEIDVDEVVIGPALDEQSHPRAAFNGTEFLVVWDDWIATARVVAARVGTDGSVLDATGIPVAVGFPVGAAWDGTQWLVGWNEFLGPGLGLAARVTRVDGSGTVLDPEGIAVSEENLLGLACGAALCLTVWTDGFVVRASRVDAAGGLLDPDGILVGAGSRAAVTFDGTVFFVAWSDWTQTMAVRISPEGALLDGTPVVVSADGNWAYPAIAAGPGQVLVVGETSAAGLVAVRVSGSGSVLDPVPIVVSPESGDRRAEVVWDGSAYFVAWVDAPPAAIKAARIAPDGSTVLPATPIVTGGVGYSGVDFVGLTASDGQLLLAWRNSPMPTDIVATRLAPEGALLDTPPILLSRSANHQVSPSVASDGASYLVAWTDARSGNEEIWGRRFDLGGARMDATTLPISTGSQYRTVPLVAWTSASYLVSWTDARNSTPGSYQTDVYAARMSASGVLLDADGLPIIVEPGWQAPKAMSCAGAACLITWAEPNGSLHRVLAAWLDLDGAISDPPGIATLSSTARLYPLSSVACTAAGCLLVWVDQRSGAAELFGARFAPGAAPLDATGFAIATAPAVPTTPAVAHAGDAWLVAWVDGRDGAGGIYATRVLDDGSVVAPAGAPLPAAAAATGGLHLADDGAGATLVTWVDDGTGTIYGTIIDHSGALIGDGGLVIASALEMTWGTATTAAASSPGRWLVAWHAYHSEPSLSVNRVSARLVTLEGGEADAGPVDAADVPSPDANRSSDGSLAADAPSPAGSDAPGADAAAVNGGGSACGCRVAGSRRPAGMIVAALAALGLLRRRSPARRFWARATRVGAAALTVVLALACAGEPAEHVGARRSVETPQLGPEIAVDDAVIGPAFDEQMRPRATSNGSEALVLWQDWARLNWLFAARVAADGSLMDPTGIFVGGEGFPIAASWDGTQWFGKFSVAVSTWAAPGWTRHHWPSPPDSPTGIGRPSRGRTPRTSSRGATCAPRRPRPMTPTSTRRGCPPRAKSSILRDAGS